MISDRVDDLKGKIEFLKNHMKQSTIKQKQETSDAVDLAIREHNKMAQSKARVHADIHRFQYAKFVAEMKQRYTMQMDQSQAQIRSLQNELAKSQQMFCSLETQLRQKEEEKSAVDSKLLQVKKSFNEEVVNYQNVQNENKENQRKLSGIIHGLKAQLEERNQYVQSVMTQIHELQEQLNDIKRQKDELQERSVTEKDNSNTTIVGLQAEVSSLQSRYATLRGKRDREIKVLNQQNENHKRQIQQLEALNLSLKESMETKDANNRKIQELHDAELEKLRAALHDVEAANNTLNEQSEKLRDENQREMSKHVEEVRRLESKNTELMDKIHSMKSDKLHEGRQWFDKEEDMRNETNVLRQQLHSATNDMGVMKFEMLEKDTLVRKLENKITGLKEQVLYHKEREQKEKQERGVLMEEISKHDVIHENKINDIKMILDAKAVRIIRLQEELQEKSDSVKRLETQIIELKNEVATARTLMKEEKNMLLESQHLESDKLKSIIADITDELNAIKSEKGQLHSALETQKNVNVQLSLELDSMKEYLNKPETARDDVDVSLYGGDSGDCGRKELEVGGGENEDDDQGHLDSALLHAYSSMTFYDNDLENSPRENTELRERSEFVSSRSMCDFGDRGKGDEEVGSDNDVLQSLNLQSAITADDSGGSTSVFTNISGSDCKSKPKRRKGPGLPLPRTSRSMGTLSSNAEELINQ